jgi:dihydrofolate synthase/folylpolyglutamate synthase
MSYETSIDYLYGLQKHGIKVGLENTRRLLASVGNPETSFKTIHIAGTNGKGSVAAMTASILKSHGFKAGLFTSPHLVSFTERIRINDVEIQAREVAALTEEIKERISEIKSSTSEDFIPTFFEVVTVMAFLYFKRNNIDWAVIETGMGGRLDSTNVIIPEVSVITKISYDHKEFLGNTIEDIAMEKAGIIKNNIPVVSAIQIKETEDIIRKTTEEKNSPFFIYGQDFKNILKSADIKGIAFDYYDTANADYNSEFSNLFVPLAGEFQALNASIALKASIQALASNFNTSAARDGLASVKWHGRLEIVSDNPLIMIDGAHNPDAANALSDFIKKHLADYKIILIMGIMADKEMKDIMQTLLPLACEIIFTAPNYGRAASAERLSEISYNMGYNSKTSASVKEAIETAKDISSSYPLSIILITGSFYTIGEAMEVLGKKPIFGDLRETV